MERRLEEVVASLLRARQEREELDFAIEYLEKAVKRRQQNATYFTIIRLGFLGISRRKAAKLIGVSPSLLYQFLDGKKSLKLEAFIKLMELSRGPKNH